MRAFKRERKPGSYIRYAFFALFSLAALLAAYSAVKTLTRSSGTEVSNGRSALKTAQKRSLVQRVEESSSLDGDSPPDDEDSFCLGMDSFELWGTPVTWGTQNLKNTSAECCQQCKEMCTSHSDCQCNSWVYCGNEEKCGQSYKQCWLKKQSDFILPEVHSTDTPWMSGIVHPKGKGFICMKTETDCIRIQLEPTWAPKTVQYVLDVLRLRHCTGCQFYRAEKFDGSVDMAAPGTPQALLQGSLLTEGIFFKPIPQEATPVVRRGYISLIQGGPDFFISLADHLEWGHSHTVFARVLEEDLPKLEKIVELPTKPENWGPNIDVQVLVDPVNFIIARADN